MIRISRTMLRAAALCAVIAAIGPSKAAQYVIPMADAASDADKVAYQTLCTGEDWVVFNATSDRTGKIVSVCMMEGDHTTPGHLTYRYGRPGQPELVYPESATGSVKRFTIRRYTRPQTTHLKFEFTDRGFNHEILDGGEGAETYAELRVVRISDGTVVASHPLTPDTKHLSLMALENIVPTAPFDE